MAIVTSVLYIVPGRRSGARRAVAPSSSPLNRPCHTDMQYRRKGPRYTSRLCLYDMANSLGWLGLSLDAMRLNGEGDRESRRTVG